MILYNIDCFLGFSWLDFGVVPPVRDQLQCGSCYIFSSLSALESHYAIKRRLEPNYFSVQYVLDCCLELAGCGGGWMSDVYQCLSFNRTVIYDVDYPYRGRVGRCVYDFMTSDSRVSIPFMKSVYNEIVHPSEGDILSLLKIGPVVVAVDASCFDFRHYKSGVFIDNGHKCSGELNHAVVIVGYGVDSITGLPYWLVRNSWSSDWGENGYIRILRRGSVAGILSYAIIPLLY